MQELKTNEFYRAKPLYTNIRYGAVIPHSVFEGNNPGRVFVDRTEKPSVALVCLRRTHAYITGDSTIEEFSLPELLLQGPNYKELYLYSYPEIWQEKVGKMLRGTGYQIYRRAFTLSVSNFSAHLNWRNRVPQGFRINNVDRELVERISHEVSSGIKGYWGSIQNFLSRGLGYCMLHDDEIVSVCYTTRVGGGECDIQINTIEKFRNQGYAALTASAFIEECLSRRLKPVWECRTDNIPSNGLAEKLGFEAIGVFPVYRCDR